MTLLTATRSRRRARQSDLAVLVEATTLAELRSAIPATDDLPPGTHGKVVIEGFGVGPLADLAGAEQAWGSFLVPAGAEVLDVHGEGLNKAIVDWRIFEVAATAMASSLAVVVFIGVVALALAALGWAISRITIFFEQAGPMILIGLVLVVGLVVLSSRGRRSS